MTDTLKNISKERFEEEFRKLFLKSPKPSVGLQLAWDLGIFEEIFPEFQYMPHTLQHPDHHPEGDVWTHTLLCVDAMAELLKHNGSYLDDDYKFTLFLAIFCHDLGKPESTTYVDGVVKSYGHDEVGVKPTRSFLKKLNVSNSITEKVCKLVEYHLRPVLLHKANSSKGAIKRLARNLYPATLNELFWVSKADKAGRGKPLSEVDFTFADWFLEKAMETNTVDKKPELVVTGKDLLKLGYTSGTKLGSVLKKVNSLHEEFDLNREELLDYAHFMLDNSSKV